MFTDNVLSITFVAFQERGAEKEKKFVMEVTQKLIGDERARVPKAKPYPYTTDFPLVCMLYLPSLLCFI